MSTVDTWVDLLPKEVLLRIFSLLPYRDLVSAGRTCKHWHGLSKDDLLIQKVVLTEFNDWQIALLPDEQICLVIFLGKKMLL